MSHAGSLFSTRRLLVVFLPSSPLIPNLFHPLNATQLPKSLDIGMAFIPHDALGTRLTVFDPSVGPVLRRALCALKPQLICIRASCPLSSFHIINQYLVRLSFFVDEYYGP